MLTLQGQAAERLIGSNRAEDKRRLLFHILPTARFPVNVIANSANYRDDAVHLACALLYREGLGEPVTLATYDRLLWQAGQDWLCCRQHYRRRCQTPTPIEISDRF